MLVLQVSGLEFSPQNLCKIRPSAREAETGGCLGLIGQPAELNRQPLRSETDSSLRNYI